MRVSYYLVTRKDATHHMKKKTTKTSNPKPSANSAETKQEQTTTQQPTQETITPVTPPPAEPTQKNETPKKEKASSISATVRRLVVKNPALTADEVSQKLIDGGWDAGDVEKRKSTIATLRTDALAIIAIAKDEGCWK